MVSLDVVFESIRILVKLLSRKEYQVAIQATDETDVVFVIINLVPLISKFLII